MLILPATAKTIAGFMAAAEAAPEELSTIANVMTAPPMPFIPEEHHGEVVILAMLVHAGPTEEGERALAPFRELATPLADMVRPMDYPEIYPPDDLTTVRPQRPARFLDTIVNDEPTDPEHLELDAMMSAARSHPGRRYGPVPADATVRPQAEQDHGHGRDLRKPDEPRPRYWVTDFAAALRQSDSGDT